MELDNDDWERVGYDVPLLVNMQPAGEYLGEEYYRAGGVPSVVAELIGMGRIDATAITVNGRSLHDNNVGRFTTDRDVIRAWDAPMLEHAGFLNLKGNLFESAIMKTSVISADFHARYLENPADPNAFEGVAVVFDGPEDYHARIDDPTLGLDENTILVIRGVGPIGYPGSAEVVNMRPPDYLLERGINELPCIGDGRQSGTSGSPSILNASPEAATGGGLALLQTGDRIRDRPRQAHRRHPHLRRGARAATRDARAGRRLPLPRKPDTVAGDPTRASSTSSPTAWSSNPQSTYQRIADTMGVPRDNH